jgi:FdhD protein
MRTPGDDEALATGFLFGEGIIRERSEVAEIRRPAGEENEILIDLAPDVDVDLRKLDRHFYTTSSCGVCGKASIDAVESDAEIHLDAATPPVPSTLIPTLPDRLRESQKVFEVTGGLHAAGLFDLAGNLLNVCEDVGRHNAVDKLIGTEFLRGALPASHRILVLSGRASFELVQKAAVAGFPILIAVSAPSSLAVELARRFQMTLIGFARQDRFNIYSGSFRILTDGG